MSVTNVHPPYATDAEPVTDTVPGSVGDTDAVAPARPRIVRRVTLAACVCTIVAAFPAWYPTVADVSDFIVDDSDGGILEGSIRQLDAQAGVVRIVRGLLPFPASRVAIGPDAEIRVRDKIGVIEDLREGARIRVCYEVRDRTRWARAIEAPPAELPCLAAIRHTPVEQRPSPEEPVRPAAPVAAPRPERNQSNAGKDPRAVHPPRVEPPRRAPSVGAPPASTVTGSRSKPAEPTRIVPGTTAKPAMPVPRTPDRAEAP